MNHLTSAILNIKDYVVGNLSSTYKGWKIIVSLNMLDSYIVYDQEMQKTLVDIFNKSYQDNFADTPILGDSFDIFESLATHDQYLILFDYALVLAKRLDKLWSFA